MFDILSNHKIARLRTPAEQSASAANQPSDDGLDMWTANQLPNRALIIVDVYAVAEGGSLTIIGQDSTDQSTWDEDWCTLTAITATGLYVADVADFYRYLRLNATVADAAISWGAWVVTFEDQRRPVTQTGTTLSCTYGTGRSGKVSAT